MDISPAPITPSVPLPGWTRALRLSGKRGPLAKQVLDEQLAEQARATWVVVATFVFHLIAVVIVTADSLERLAIVWALANLMVLAAFVLVQRGVGRRLGARSQMRLIAAGGALMGLLWVGLSVVVIDQASSLSQNLFGTVLISMMVAGGCALAASPPAALAFTGTIAIGEGVLALLATIPAIEMTISLVMIVVPALALARSVVQHARSLARQVGSAEHLREQGEVIRLLLNDYEQNSSDWLWEVDAENRLTHVPPRFAQLLGRSVADLIGVAIVEGLGGEAGRSIAVMLSGHQVTRDWVTAIEIGGEMRWWSLSASPTTGPDGSHSGFRGVGADVTDAKRNQEQIERMASSDGLTGLANRAALRGHIQSALDLARAVGGSCAVMLIDLDRFKSVNDTLGHHVGDELLREVAKRLRHELDDMGGIARLGGDEFALVVPGMVADAALAFATRLIEMLSEVYAIKANPIRIGASIGVALGPDDGGTIDDLLRAADLALYRAKDDAAGWRDCTSPRSAGMPPNAASWNSRCAQRCARTSLA